MTAKPLSSHARKTWVILFSVMLGTSLQLSCQKSASSSAGAGGGVGGTTTAEEEVELEVSGTIDPTDFVQAQDSVEIGGVNLTTAGKYAISAFYLSPLGKKVPVYQGTSDSERFSFKSKVPKRYLTIDVTRLSDGYRLGAFLPPALRNKLAKLRLNRASSIAAKMATIVADKAAAGDEAALKVLATNSISVADTLIVAQSVARVITQPTSKDKGISIDLAALAAKLVEKSNDKMTALQGEGQSAGVVAEKISEKTYETVFSGDAEATSPGVLAYRTNHDLGTSTVAKRDVAYEAIKDLSGDSTKYVDAAFRVEANAFRSASGLSDAVAAENSVATTYSTKFSECYAGNYNCAPAGYTPPAPPSSSSTGNGGNGSGSSSGSNPPAIPVITINSPPSSQTAANGAATFSVSASVTQNAALSYQWQKKEAGASSFVNMNTETSSNLSLSGLTNANDNGDMYQVIVSATGGATRVTSSAATLTVNPCPSNGWCAEESTYYIGGAATDLNMTGSGTWNGQTYTTGSLKAVITITSDPSNQTASNGSATFSVTATATNSANLSYQWQKQENGSGAFNDVGTNSTTLSLSSLSNADDNNDVYRVVVSATGGATSVTSNTATLTVDGSSSSPTTYEASGSADWGSSANGTYASSGGECNGQPVYLNSGSPQGWRMFFYVGYEGDTGRWVIQNSASCDGSGAAWMNFSGNITGTYFGSYGQQSLTVAGSSSAPDGGGSIAQAPGVPTAVSGTAGNTQVSLTWTAPSSNGGSAITDYIVQHSSNSGSSWTTFDDGTSTSASATVTGLTNGTAYTFQVAAVNSAGTGSYSSSSSPVTPIVPTPVISITSQPGNQTASGGSATFSVTAVVTNSANLSYQWQKQESGAGSFADVSGATSATLSLSSLTNAADNSDVYRVLVSATGGATGVTSSSATLTVQSSVVSGVVITSVPASFSNINVYPTEYSLAGQYFCRAGLYPGGGSWVNRGVKGLSGPPWLGDACTCSDNPNDCVYSGDHSFAFVSWPHWETGEPDSWTGWLFYVGGSAPVVFNNSQDSTNVPTTGWKDSTDGIGNPNARASSFSLVESCAANGWCVGESKYYLGGQATTLDLNGSGTWNSQTYTVGVLKSIVTITSQPSNQTAANGSASFSVSVSVTNGATLSYQWQKQESGAGSFADVSGATSATLSLSSLTNAADNSDVYRVLVSATGGATGVTSSSATLTVTSQPSNIGGYVTDNDNWMGATGTYCPEGTFDGVPYYRNAENHFMYREGTYWYIDYTDGPGRHYAAPSGFIQSNASIPPLSGWSNGGSISTATCPPQPIPTGNVGYVTTNNAGETNPWQSRSGTFCPAGYSNGVLYYVNNNASGSWVMYRFQGSWIVRSGTNPVYSPGTSIANNENQHGNSSSTPPLSGWVVQGPGDFDTGTLASGAGCE